MNVVDDTRRYELAKAPVKRLLQNGSQVIHDQHYSTSKFRMTEGALLTFRKAVEDYALALAEEIGKSTYYHDRNTIKIVDVENAMSKIPVPHPTLPEPETTKPEPEIPSEIPWKAGFYEEITADESFKLCEAFCQRAINIFSKSNSEKEIGNLQNEAQDILDMLWKRAGIHGWPWGSVEWKKNIEKIRDKAGQKLQELGRK